MPNPRSKHSTKYCHQAQAMLATLERCKQSKWGNTGKGSTASSLAKHLEACMKCGRDLEGKPWPPP